MPVAELVGEAAQYLKRMNEALFNRSHAAHTRGAMSDQLELVQDVTCQRRGRMKESKRALHLFRQMAVGRKRPARQMVWRVVQYIEPGGFK